VPSMRHSDCGDSKTLEVMVFSGGGGIVRHLHKKREVVGDSNGGGQLSSTTKSGGRVWFIIAEGWGLFMGRKNIEEYAIL